MGGVRNTLGAKYIAAYILALLRIPSIFDVYPHRFNRVVSSILIFMYVTGTHVQRVQIWIASGIRNRLKCHWQEFTVGRANLNSLGPLRFPHPTIIMPSENPSETNRIRKVAGSFKGKLSSLLKLSRGPSPSSIEMDSSSDNPTRWVTIFFSPTFHWNNFVLL